MSELIYLNEAMDPVSEPAARYSIDRREHVLIFSTRGSDGSWRSANPYAFGASFWGKKPFKTDVVLKLLQYTLPPNPENADFPRAKQIAAIKVYGPSELDVKISAKVAEAFIELYLSCFPVFWRYAVTEESCIVYDGFYGRYLATREEEYHYSTSYRELVEDVTGVARKDTLREFRELNEDQVALLSVFRGLLPPETMLASLKRLPSRFFDFLVEPSRYLVLQRLSQTVRLRLFEDTILSRVCDPGLMNDALTMLEDMEDGELKRLKGVRSWMDLHNRVMRLTALDGDEEIVLKTPPELMKLSESTRNEDMQLVPLMRASEFLHVGQVLDICIGTHSYFSRARNGESYCLTGLREGKPATAVEVAFQNERWKVLQYRGFANELPEGHREVVADWEARLKSFTVNVAQVPLS